MMSLWKLPCLLLSPSSVSSLLPRLIRNVKEVKLGQLFILRWMPSLIIFETIWAVLFIRLIWIVLVLKLKATRILGYRWSFSRHPGGFFSCTCLVAKPRCLKRAAFSSLASIFHHRLISPSLFIAKPPSLFLCSTVLPEFRLTRWRCAFIT